VQALKIQPRRRRHPGHTVVVFRERRILEEKQLLKQPLKETPESMRLMMLRDQINDLVGIMRQHREAVVIVGGLLKDEHVGVGAIAADVLKEAVIAGVDVSPSEGALKEAIGNRYAQRNAAGALALLYVKRGDVSAMGKLLSHRDQAVRDAAGTVCTDAPDGLPKG
jgi:hypothetical protein